MDEGSGKSGGLGGGSEHLEVVVGGRAEAIGRAAWSPHATRIRRKIKIFGVHPGTVKGWVEESSCQLRCARIRQRTRSCG